MDESATTHSGQGRDHGQKYYLEDLAGDCVDIGFMKPEHFPSRCSDACVDVTMMRLPFLA
jgi:hypothetical protein